MVLIDWLIFALYRYVGLPLVLMCLHFFRPFLPTKIQEMISDREPRNLQALPARPIWVHASSGEIEYAKSVIRSLKESFPQTPVLVTYFSPSAKKLIQKFPGIDLAMALPWDEKLEIEKFLNFYNPRVCLVARTDVWPEMALQLRKRKIPAALFAATFAKESSRRGIFSGSLTRIALNALSVIFCVSSEDQNNLQDLGVRCPVEVGGDTRFDQVLFRLANPNSVKTSLQPSSRQKILVCGSTWPQDEEVLLPVFQFWFSQGGRVIIAPHEVAPERISELEKKFAGKGWTCQKYSDSQSWESQVLLVDQVGCLQEVYSWGCLAFVGGSFKDKVHSVMEPLCAGLPVFVGPFHKNNREALQFQHVLLDTNFFAVNVVRNSPEIESLMSRALTLPSPNPVLLQKVKKAAGATHELLHWVESLK